MTERQLNVLLVEDDEDDYVIVRKLLSGVEGQRYNLEWVATYEAALEAMENNGYDVYLVDYRLGARNGLELFREAVQRGCHAPMILLTGQGDHRVDMEAMKAGAADYLAKGQIDTALLERSIRYAVERVRNLEALSRQADELAEINQMLEEKDRLLSAFHRIGRVALSSLDMDKVLDNLAIQIVAIGIFQNITIALVDEQARSVEIVRRLVRENGPRAMTPEPNVIGLRYGLDDDSIFASVARSGRMEVIQGWDERFDPKLGGPEEVGEKVSYFIPVKEEEGVLAVLATDSRTKEQVEVLRRIEVMRPLLDQVAIAIQHARTNRQLKETQVQMVQWEKMVSLGQMAAGIAHEINNPVGYVMSNLQTLSEYTAVFKRLLNACETLCESAEREDGGELWKVVQQIQQIRSEEDLSYILSDLDNLLQESGKGTERVKEIVQGLKNFARMDGYKMQQADFNERIREALKVAWNELKGKCRVHKEFGELPPIQCCPGQLTQVFVNLLVNAAQAIREKGEITIRTEETETHVVARVSDTGEGIPEEVSNRVFEPFFTTKPVGEGTGLGLAISYGIVQAHKGSIEVRSARGKGTEFTVRIPKNIKEAAEEGSEDVERMECGNG